MEKFTLKKLGSRVYPKGTYNVVVDSVKIKENRKDASLKDLMVVFKITDGTHKDKTIVETIYNGAFEFRLAPFAKAIDADLEREFSSMDELLEYVAEKAQGTALTIDLIITSYNGNEYNSVHNFIKGNKSVTSEEEVTKAFELSEDEEDDDDLSSIVADADLNDTEDLL